MYVLLWYLATVHTCVNMCFFMDARSLCVCLSPQHTEQCNEQCLPPFIPPSSHILFTSFSLSLIRPVGSSQQRKKKVEEGVGVGEVDAQTEYEWKNKNLCAENQHLLSTCSCAISPSFFFVFCSSLALLPRFSFVPQSFGSRATCRSQEADGMVNFRGQIIQ